MAALLRRGSGGAATGGVRGVAGGGGTEPTVRLWSAVGSEPVYDGRNGTLHRNIVNDTHKNTTIYRKIYMKLDIA